MRVPNCINFNFLKLTLKLKMAKLTEKQSYLKLKEYYDKNAVSLNLREMFKDEERFNKFR